jgi:hypothetical protein
VSRKRWDGLKVSRIKWDTLKVSPIFAAPQLETRFFELNPVECEAPSEGVPLAPTCTHKSEE